jgi:hypothetical protein
MQMPGSAQACKRVRKGGASRERRRTRRWRGGSRSETSWDARLTARTQDRGRGTGLRCGNAGRLQGDAESRRSREAAWLAGRGVLPARGAR